MHNETKKELDKRVKNIKKLNASAFISAITILHQFIEHPSKPGYRRKDIEYVLKQLAGHKVK